MKREEHIKHCEQVLGEGFPEVHDFLDQYQPQLGPEHRAVLHNGSGVLQCILDHGYMAGAAACLHILADEQGFIQKNDGTFGRAPIVGWDQAMAGKPNLKSIVKKNIDTPL